MRSITWRTFVGWPHFIRPLWSWVRDQFRKGFFWGLHGCIALYIRTRGNVILARPDFLTQKGKTISVVVMTDDEYDRFRFPKLHARRMLERGELEL